MRADDLAAIQNIAAIVHPALSEDTEVFAEKLSLFPEGCFILIENGAILGYAFVHPWRFNEIPKLDTLLHRLPSPPECILVHDVAMLKQARGRGAARALVELVSKLAREREISKLALVSVYNAHLQWAQLGFEPVRNDHVAEQLQSYGNEARYMVRRVG